jgi:hypothetical protein
MPKSRIRAKWMSGKGGLGSEQGISDKRLLESEQGISDKGPEKGILGKNRL